MSYDSCLGRRLSEMLGERAGFQPKRMFGGIGWLLHDHLCVGVYQSWLIVRVGVETAARLVGNAHVKPMDITGKPMKGWAMVAGEGLTEDGQLERYIGLAIEYVSSLPAKKPRTTATEGKR